MINWQILGLLALVLAAATVAIYASPNSYRRLYLTEQCEPQPCHMLAARRDRIRPDD